MNAFEARQKSIDPQYKRIMAEIQEAIDNKKTGLSALGDKILPEVAQRLADEGFDVTIYSPFPRYDISWENATEPGRKGKINEEEFHPLEDFFNFLEDFSEMLSEEDENTDDCDDCGECSECTKCESCTDDPDYCDDCDGCDGCYGCNQCDGCDGCEGFDNTLDDDTGDGSAKTDVSSTNSTER